MVAYRVSTFPDGILPCIEPTGLPYAVVEVDAMTTTRVFYTKKRNTQWENVLNTTHRWFTTPAGAMAFSVELMALARDAAQARANMLAKRIQDIELHGKVLK